MSRELASSVLRFFHLIAQKELPDVDELAAQIERDEKAAEAYRELHAVADKVVEVIPNGGGRQQSVVAEMKSQLGPKHAAKAKPIAKKPQPKPVKVIKKKKGR